MSARPRTRQDEIVIRLDAFAEANPNVEPLFDRLMIRAIERDPEGPRKKRWGARMIWEMIRWEVNIQTEPVDGTRIRLNDHFIAYYARAFLLKYPEHQGIFRLRPLKSANRPPRNRPETVDPDLAQEELLFDDGNARADEVVRRIFGIKETDDEPDR